MTNPNPNPWTRNSYRLVFLIAIPDENFGDFTSKATTNWTPELTGRRVAVSRHILIILLD